MCEVALRDVVFGLPLVVTGFAMGPHLLRGSSMGLWKERNPSDPMQCQLTGPCISISRPSLVDLGIVKLLEYYSVK